MHACLFVSPKNVFYFIILCQKKNVVPRLQVVRLRDIQKNGVQHFLHQWFESELCFQGVWGLFSGHPRFSDSLNHADPLNVCEMCPHFRKWYKTYCAFGGETHNVVMFCLKLVFLMFRKLCRLWRVVDFRPPCFRAAQCLCDKSSESFWWWFSRRTSSEQLCLHSSSTCSQRWENQNVYASTFISFSTFFTQPFFWPAVLNFSRRLSRFVRSLWTLAAVELLVLEIDSIEQTGDKIQSLSLLLLLLSSSFFTWQHCRCFSCPVFGRCWPFFCLRTDRTAALFFICRELCREPPVSGSGFLL